MWRNWTLSKTCSLAVQPRLVAPDWTVMAERATSSCQSFREVVGIRPFLKKNSMYSKISIFPSASIKTYACLWLWWHLTNYNDCTEFWPDLLRHLENWQYAPNKATEPHVHCTYLPAFSCCSYKPGYSLMTMCWDYKVCISAQKISVFLFWKLSKRASGVCKCENKSVGKMGVSSAAFWVDCAIIQISQICFFPQYHFVMVP